MCFILKTDPTQAKSIAKEDIVCYKVCQVRNNKIRAYFRGYYEYKLNDLNILGKSISFFCLINIYFADEGFHSYVSCKYKNYGSEIICVPNKEDLVYYDKPSLIECIIPKGAVYYKNDDGEYISEQIILKKILKPSLKIRLKYYAEKINQTFRRIYRERISTFRK